MTIARILGLILAPTGVLVCAWAYAFFRSAPGPGIAALPAHLGTALGLAMILVGVRYLFKKRVTSTQPNSMTPASAERLNALKTPAQGD